jgi:hypothetical protein
LVAFLAEMIRIFSPRSSFFISYNDNLTFQNAESDKTGFAVVKTLIRDDDNSAIKDLWDIDEIYAMFLDIRSTFSFIPIVTHIPIVKTKCSYVNQFPPTKSFHYFKARSAQVGLYEVAAVKYF